MSIVRANTLPTPVDAARTPNNPLPAPSKSNISVILSSIKPVKYSSNSGPSPGPLHPVKCSHSLSPPQIAHTQSPQSPPRTLVSTHLASSFYDLRVFGSFLRVYNRLVESSRLVP